MPKHLTCDECGAAEGVTEDYDGHILCERHRIASDLHHARIEYNNKLDWVKRVHIGELRDMRKEITRLEKLLAEKVSEQ